MNRTIKKILVILIIVLLILFIAVKIFKIQNVILKKIYPQEYSEYVYKYAEEYKVDPLLIFAIIKAESNFNPNVVSNSEAIGLMQLMDATAEEISNKLNVLYVKKASLYNPEFNIQLGTKYFSNLMKEYDNNYLLALTAYNAGIGNVNKWIEARNN